MKLRWRPSIFARAEVRQDDVEPIAERDAGWAELWNADGNTRLGRGHLILWANANHIGDAVGDAAVDADAAQPVGEGAADLRAELRSFTPETDNPDPGGPFLIVPEHDQQRYSVEITQVVPGDEHGKAILELDWPDDQLPTALSELGGH